MVWLSAKLSGEFGLFVETKLVLRLYRLHKERNRMSTLLMEQSHRTVRDEVCRNVISEAHYLLHLKIRYKIQSKLSSK